MASDDDMITLPNGNKVRNATECGNCGATGDDLKKCNKCHVEAYCSRGELITPSYFMLNAFLSSQFIHSIFIIFYFNRVSGRSLEATQINVQVIMQVEQRR
jgi:hypothetical protein